MTHPWALLAAPSSGGPDIPGLLLTLAAVLAATKIVGALARRIGQPAVLGELVAGILLGGSVLGVLDPSEPVLKTLAELGESLPQLPDDGAVPARSCYCE